MKPKSKNPRRKTPGKISLGWFLRNFRRKLVLPRSKSPRPIILAAAGPSRVGKTTVFRFIQKRLPYFVRIAHDDMRLFLYGCGFPDSPIVEKFLYNAAPSYIFAEQFLRRGYGVILDDNFATKPIKAKMAKSLAQKTKARFFLIRVWAPAGLVRKRLRKTKSKLFPDWRVGLAHFERSRKQFNYEKPSRMYFAKINTAKPLAPQLKKILLVLKAAMD